MKLNSIISDGVVFQSEQPIVIFGEGHGKITAEFLGEVREYPADGKFIITFSPHPAGGPYEMRVSDGVHHITIGNIMIGKVILLAGQSNAELTVAETYDRDTVFQSNDNIRFFAPTRPTIDGEGNIIPLETPFNERWNLLSGDEANQWPAIALHTAEYYYNKLNVPVGIVTCFKAATVIESFMSEKANAQFAPDPSKLMADHFLPIFAWNKPAFLYHYMFEKLVPFQTGAVIWYQGESNRTVYEGGFYDKMLLTMIDEWRELFNIPDLPFAVVQINKYPDPVDGVEAIRAAQERAVKQADHCGLVRIDDLGEHEKIHPENKREVSMRICAVLDSLEK